jgi:hypothetical protein
LQRRTWQIPQLPLRSYGIHTQIICQSGPKVGHPQKLIAYFLSLTIVNTCSHLEWWDLKKWKTLEKSWNEMKKEGKEWMGCIGTKCMHPNPSYHTQRWKNLCCWNLWNTSFHSFWAF